MKTTDYVESLNIIPPKEHLDSFKSDYKEMIGSMIREETGNFEDLLGEIMEKLKEKTQ